MYRNADTMGQVAVGNMYIQKLMKGKCKMNKALEYTKKLALVRLLYRKQLLSDAEYEKIRRELQKQVWG